MMNETLESGQQRRILWLLIVVAIAGAYLYILLVGWQLFVRGDDIPGLLDRGSTIPAVRGAILDATGHYLAVNTVQYELDITPRMLSGAQIERLVPSLAVILKRQEKDLYTEITNSNKSNYVVLGRELSAQTGRELFALEKELLNDTDKGIKFAMNAFVIAPSSSRAYPDDGIAAQVIGLINKQDVKTGLEARYDNVLSGVDGVRRNLSGQFFTRAGGYQPVQDGADLVLTIDRNIQAEAEWLLLEQAGVSETKSIRGTIVVLDSHTGAVLALASSPTFQPGRWQEWADQPKSAFINTAVSSQYEPRATFMPLTIAAALETRVISTELTYVDSGEMTLGGQKFINWDLSTRPAVTTATLTDTITTSRAVGAVYIASLMGSPRFYEMVRRFGFGEPTGIDLPSERAGDMQLPGSPNWVLAFLGFHSIGRALTVTPIQLAAAYGALANDGVLMRPYLVSEQRSGAEVTVTQPYRVRRVVSAEVAQSVTRMLAEAVAQGQSEALVPGYRFAGISSTTGKPGFDNLPRGVPTSAYIGYGPLPQNRYVVLVWFDESPPAYFGNDVAAPVFGKMVRYLMDYMGIAPDATNEVN
ncbi:MAG: peptidoglycan D,D-transpeptidase FtsI family protein [Anaerolineae bacterium]